MRAFAEFKPGILAWSVFVFTSAAISQPVTNRVTLAPGNNDAASAGLSVEKGFRLEVAAAEPMVSRPVAIAFDENNRLYVAEIPDELAAGGRKPSLGRVRLLDSPDANGRFRNSTVFAQDLSWPSALACYAGGVFVAVGKEIVYLKDTDADGDADVRKIVFTGFGGTNTLGGDLLLNSFNWGLDNRIHAATAGLGGAVSIADLPGEPLPLKDSDFSFDPRTLRVVLEDGCGEQGLAFNSSGRRYVSAPGYPLRLAMAERRYWVRNPSYLRAAPFSDVMNPATAVFPHEPAETARHPAAEPKQTTPVWLKAARGTTIYRGHLFPTNYAENAFICDPEAHVVHRVVLQENGLTVVGTRAAAEKVGEFLGSAEPSFRPVQAANGPDGALYIVDSRDADRGRIYRIVPENFTRPEPVKLGASRNYDLVAALADANGWHRDTAARLLFERRDPTALPLLSNMVFNAQLPLAKIHALAALAGMGALQEPHVTRALQDKDPRVRVQALRAAELLATNGVFPDAAWARLKMLSSDTSLLVRYQAAFTIGASRRPDKGLLLAQLLSRDAANPWLQSAVLSALNDTAGNLCLILAGDRRFRNDPSGLNFLQRLSGAIGLRGRMDEVGQVLGAINQSKLEPLQAFSLVTSIGEGLHRTRSSLALVDPQAVLQGLYSTALLTAVDVTVAEPVRTEAVKLVGVSPYTYADTSDWLLLIANPQPLQSLRAAAVSTLGKYDDPRVVPALLERWSGFTPLLRRHAIETLTSHQTRVPVVLDAIERGAIPIADVPSPVLNFFRTYPDPAVSQKALKLFGPVMTTRPAVIAQYAPVLRMNGVPARGRDIFNLRCAECHALGGGAGRFVGPDLAGARVNGRTHLLKAILEPSAEVSPDYFTCIMQTQAGEVFRGVKAEESPLSLALLRASGQSAVWARGAINSLTTQPWSLMPDGLEQGMTHQNLADLLDFLMNPPDLQGW